MTQDILNDMDSDLVNSIADTDEALQVANIIRTTFYELFTLKRWPHSKKVDTLQSVNDSEFPTYLKLPENLIHLHSVTYDKSLKDDKRLLQETVKWREPEAFLRLTNAFNIQNDNVEVRKTIEGVTLKVMNDRAPQYYTTFDDEYLVFDSYDIEVEDTLRGDKTQAICTFTPDFRMIDTFVPDMPTEAFPYLLAEAKSTASLKIRQVADEKAEQQSRRQSIRASQRARRAASGMRYPDYGRRGRKGSTNYYNTKNRQDWSTYDGFQ